MAYKRQLVNANLTPRIECQIISFVFMQHKKVHICECKNVFEMHITKNKFNSNN